MGMCGLEDQCWVQEQRDSSSVMVNVLCLWVRHFTISSPLDPDVLMGTANAGKVTGSLWRMYSEPDTTEKWVWPILLEREMGAPTCVHRLKAYLTYLQYTKHTQFQFWVQTLLQHPAKYAMSLLTWDQRIYKKSFSVCQCPLMLLLHTAYKKPHFSCINMSERFHSNRFVFYLE